MDAPEELRAYRAAAPWRVRVAGRGEAVAARRVASPPRRARDARRLVLGAPRRARSLKTPPMSAREHGFRRVLSPLLPVDLLGGYRRAGMRDLAADRRDPGDSRPHARGRRPAGYRADRGDSPLTPPRWRRSTRSASTSSGATEPTSSASCCRASDARSPRAADGEVIGYTLATVSRGAAVLSRLCTAPEARRRGVGAALLSDVGRWCRQTGAVTIALCTQEENTRFPSAVRLGGTRRDRSSATGSPCERSEERRGRWATTEARSSTRSSPPLSSCSPA